MIVDDSFPRLTTSMIVDDSFSVSCFEIELYFAFVTLCCFLIIFLVSSLNYQTIINNHAGGQTRKTIINNHEEFEHAQTA